MPWWVKATIEWFLARAPAGEWVHRQLQERFGELANPGQSTRFNNALYFLKKARDLAGPLENLHVVELGTGWVPAIPVSFLVCGSRVDTFDVTRLVQREMLPRCLHEIGLRTLAIAEAAGVLERTVCERFELIRDDMDFEQAARRLGGSYRAPWDTCHLPFDDDQVDVVVSSLVLAQIPIEMLDDVLRETMRVLKPGGMAVHHVYLGDEYAAGDPRRSALEFLKYSRKMWDRYFNHSLKHVNRLRHADFMQRFDDLGFETVECETRVDPKNAPPEHSQLADEFGHVNRDELAILGSQVVLRKPLGIAEVSSRTEQLIGSPAM